MLAFGINEIFSYELFLKCLILLESPQAQVPDSHDLAALFKRLSPELRQELIAGYEVLASRDINQTVLRLQSPPNWFGFEAQIKRLSVAYLKLRYYFGHDSFAIEHSTGIGQALQCAIIARKPEWKPWSSMIDDGKPKTVVQSGGTMIDMTDGLATKDRWEELERLYQTATPETRESLLTQVEKLGLPGTNGWIQKKREKLARDGENRGARQGRS